VEKTAGTDLQIPNGGGSNWCEERANYEIASSAFKDTAVLRLRQQAAALMHLKKLAQDRTTASSSDPENGSCRDASRQPRNFGTW